MGDQNQNQNMLLYACLSLMNGDELRVWYNCMYNCRYTYDGTRERVVSVFVVARTVNIVNVPLMNGALENGSTRGKLALDSPHPLCTNGRANGAIIIDLLYNCPADYGAAIMRPSRDTTGR